VITSSGQNVNGQGYSETSQHFQKMRLSSDISIGGSSSKTTWLELQIVRVNATIVAVINEKPRLGPTGTAQVW